MKNKTLKSGELYRVNKSNTDLIELLSPESNPTNQELFYKKSGNQQLFSSEIRRRGIERLGAGNLELDDCLLKIQDSIQALKKEYANVKKSKLDLDIAKIFHEHLPLPRAAVIDYDFWRYITLFHFIELVKWRWESPPENPANWYSNAKAICGRAIGITLNKKKFDEEKIIQHTSRSQRIDSYRYWWIANRLYDPAKGYYYLEKISESLKGDKDAAIQDFLNQLEGNKLLSESDRISKLMAEAILLENRKFSQAEIRNCFSRYNAFSNRLFMVADKQLIQREICLV
ncbi:MAG: hypothetical protein K0S09_2530 [Sphingobacteriaceae bacterium]|jgi:hypothetical protein|nr:hypothetical protein [Sphingobacteriaceae bacterium]